MQISSSRSVTFPAALLCALLLCVARFPEVASQLNGANGANGQPSTYPYQQPPPGGSSQENGGLFHLIWSPIRGAIDTAREIIGQGLENVADHMDKAGADSFRMFMTIYNKTYSASEIPRRMALFVRRRELIEESERQYREGRAPFVMRANSFLDWDEDELKKLAGVSMPNRSQLTPEELAVLSPPKRVARSVDGRHHYSFEGQSYDWANMTVRADTPASKDWRDSGCVAAPMDQQQCGACYAIATMNVVETMRCLNKDSSPTLSPQQIVDCATPRAGYQNFGCDGGWPTRVLNYLQDVGVAARDRCYPFAWRQNSCRLRSMSSSDCTVSSSPTDSRLRYRLYNNERDILRHVATTGPVVTVMRATDKFLYYGRGIFDDHSCSRRRDDVDHAITIVGYGREQNTDYWLIKNSWGAEWGEAGYGKYKRGTNACSIGHWGWAITS